MLAGGGVVPGGQQLNAVERLLVRPGLASHKGLQQMQVALQRSRLRKEKFIDQYTG